MSRLSLHGGVALLLSLSCGTPEANPRMGDVDGSDLPSSAAAVFTGCDGAPAFGLGSTADSHDGRVQAALLAASALPPARFLNDWTVNLELPQGGSLDDATVRSVSAYMPQHGHYGKPDPLVTPRADRPDAFDIAALNLFMRGSWQVRLTVASPSAGEDLLTFEVCVEE
jgi:hypothetical protein